MTHPVATHSLMWSQDQTYCTRVRARVCAFDFMTNEEQELAVRLASPLVYYTASSGCPCTQCTCVCVCVCACKPPDKLHIAHGFEVCVQGWTLSWMRCEGTVCAWVSVRYELNTGWLLAPTSVALHCEAFLYCCFFPLRYIALHQMYCTSSNSVAVRRFV